LKLRKMRRFVIKEVASMMVSSKLKRVGGSRGGKLLVEVDDPRPLVTHGISNPQGPMASSFNLSLNLPLGAMN
jgi:hypothetical protein